MKNAMIRNFLGTGRSENVEHVNIFYTSDIDLRKCSERIAETSYFLPWYDFPEDVAKNVKTIILRTYLPSCLSGAKILNLSLQAFCDVSPHVHWSAKIFEKLDKNLSISINSCN
ncbi:hypothetical protein E2986_11702 [Frieseomelitta varia]|uniref:Uncharacterized protein n=1 Tax=Frieseomelitta varia TaxID=561572 RepID=A0A833RJ30_9HYME|nr:hypothetical protein E2986_11702 [Frieseomelitta varia]